MTPESFWRSRDPLDPDPPPPPTLRMFVVGTLITAIVIGALLFLDRDYDAPPPNTDLENLPIIMG